MVEATNFWNSVSGSGGAAPAARLPGGNIAQYPSNWKMDSREGRSHNSPTGVFPPGVPSGPCSAIPCCDWLEHSNVLASRGSEQSISPGVCADCALASERDDEETELPNDRNSAAVTPSAQWRMHMSGVYNILGNTVMECPGSNLNVTNSDVCPRERSRPVYQAIFTRKGSFRLLWVVRNGIMALQ